MYCHLSAFGASSSFSANTSATSQIRGLKSYYYVLSTAWHSPEEDKIHLRALEFVQRAALFKILSAFRTVATQTLEVTAYMTLTSLRLKQDVQNIISNLYPFALSPSGEHQGIPPQLEDEASISERSGWNLLQLAAEVGRIQRGDRDRFSAT